MDTVLSLILLLSEMLKIQRAKAEAHFLKKIALVTNRCLAQDAFGERFKINSSAEILMCTYFLISHIFYKAILVSELYRLLRCIALYKQP